MPALCDDSEKLDKFKTRLRLEVEIATRELRSSGLTVPTALVERFKVEWAEILVNIMGSAIKMVPEVPESDWQKIQTNTQEVLREFIKREG